MQYPLAPCERFPQHLQLSQLFLILMKPRLFWYLHEAFTSSSLSWYDQCHLTQKQVVSHHTCYSSIGGRHRGSFRSCRAFFGLPFLRWWFEKGWASIDYQGRQWPLHCHLILSTLCLQSRKSPRCSVSTAVYLDLVLQFSKRRQLHCDLAKMRNACYPSLSEPLLI